ncbi:MAG: GHKL domain-containing protein [Lachnospiraceae bacterium]|nr:GHKL domain-containing protein [Lachnospiraceae bacterium]
MFNAFIEKMNDELSNALEHENSNEKLRALRHEIRNEYVPIKEMLANGDYESARKLLDEFSGDWERSLATYKTVNSGNKMIDSVFNYFIRKYSENGYNADFMIERCDIDQSMEKDICQIQINLLKNAFEAAGKTSEKTVRVMMFTEKNYLKIRVLNSVSGNVADALKNVQNEHTTKSDMENHGFGIPAVKTKLRLLHGYFMCFEEDGLFGCEMGVPVKMNSWV